MKRYVYNTLTGVAAQDFTIKPDFECWELTEQIENDLLGKVKPKIVDGVVVETATPDEIVQASAPLVPSEVPLWKLRFILGQMGLEDAVSAAINQLPEPTRSAGNYLWNIGTAVERYSPTVSLIKQTLTIDDAQADQIFINADLVRL